MSYHIAGLGNSELPKNRGSHVSQRGIGPIDLAVAQQNPGYERVVDAMVATPGVRVVRENLRGKVSQNRIPAGTVSAVVANDQVRSLVSIRALVNLTGPINSRDSRGTVLRIANGKEFGPEFFQQRIGLGSRCHNSIAFAASEVQIEAVQSDGVGSSSTPIDIRKRSALARIAAGTELGVAVL